MGYIGNRWSVRAQQAYSEGLLTRAKINGAVLKKTGIHAPVGLVKWMMAEGHIKPSEWHHTGSMYNETDFYDLEDVAGQLQSMDMDAMAKLYGVSKEKPEAYKAMVVYREWSGSRKFGKFVEYEDEAVIEGNWAILSSGKRKKVDGKHFEIVEVVK